MKIIFYKSVCNNYRKTCRVTKLGCKIFSSFCYASFGFDFDIYFPVRKPKIRKITTRRQFITFLFVFPFDFERIQEYRPSRL